MLTHQVQRKFSAEVVNLAASDDGAEASTPSDPEATLQRPRLSGAIAPWDVQQRPSWDQNEEAEQDEEDEVKPAEERMP
jgi:hypothetical protein